MIKDVAILGLGLMGGSLGLALKRSGSSITVHGSTRSDEQGRLAVKLGAVDHLYQHAVEAASRAELVVCCAPILAIPEQVTMIRDALRPGTIITDVGSTKAVVQTHCNKILQGRDVVFIGSHPIAGSELQGMNAAHADLYQRAVVVITPGPDCRPADAAIIRDLWTGVGGVVTSMDAALHDQMLALTSHLPHIMASILSSTIGRSGSPAEWPRYCGTGYRDTTRIAAGGISIWMDILKTNRTPILTELRELSTRIDHVIQQLDDGDFSAIETLLEEGRHARQRFTDYGHQANSEE